MSEPVRPVPAPASGWGYLVAAFLLLVPCLAPVAAVLGFAAGVTITAWHLPLVLAASAAATAGIARAEGLRAREAALAVAVGLAVLGAAVAAGHAALDLSYDGQAYHQSSIRLLVEGWNPLRRSVTPAETTHGLWLDHYVRAAELGAATVAAATGSLEAGKALGMALTVPATLLGALALRRAGSRRGAALAAALVVAANPIVLSQLATFYVDGELALVFACALALAWLALEDGARTAPLLLGAAVALLANVKFTATVYAALLLAAYVGTALRRAPARPARVWAPVLVGVGVALAVGWQPLATNAVRYGHPFHPVAGASRVDGQSGQTPWFRYRDPVRRLVESTFSESSAARTVPSAKLPFVVRERELVAMGHPDVRVGGFGPLFGLAVVAVLLGLGALPWSRPGAATRAGLLVAAGVLGTVLVNPGAWWARFVPQLWIAVAVAGVALAASGKASRVCGLAAVAALASDALLAGASVARHQLDTQAAAGRQARALALRGVEIALPRGEMECLDLRLARFGVRSRYVAACDRALPLDGTYALYCEPPAFETRPAAAPAPR